MFPSWWRNLVQLTNNNGKNLRRGRRRASKLARQWRPALEQFEDRLVPTTVSIPNNLTGARGGTVLTPINVDTLNDLGNGNQGLGAGSFVVYYNPAVFSISPSDINIGTMKTNGSASAGNGYAPSTQNSVNNGWSVSTGFPTVGEVVITLTNIFRRASSPTAPRAAWSPSISTLKPRLPQGQRESTWGGIMVPSFSPPYPTSSLPISVCRRIRLTTPRSVPATLIPPPPTALTAPLP
jgi:hypothetical protein